LFAALNDNTEMVQLLLDAGADIDGEALYTQKKKQNITIKKKKKKKKKTK